MDLGSLFLITALALLVVLFVSRPFYGRKPGKAWLPRARYGRPDFRNVPPDREKQHSSLMAEHERLLSALQELEFDFTLGKIPAEEYPDQRMRLVRAGAAVLKELDGFENAGDEIISIPAEERMENEAARISLAGRQPSDKNKDPDDLEALIADRRRKRSEKSAGFCPKCGKPAQSSDEFCPKCGQKL
jgi:rubrerythrin